jgi:hypothetical protein
MRPAKSSFRIEQHGGQREIVGFGRVIGASEPVRPITRLKLPALRKRKGARSER